MGFLKCMLYLAALGVISFLVGRLIPQEWIHADRFPFRCCDWEENGSVYNVFSIRKWQNKVPDMSKLFPRLMQEKKMTRNFREDLPVMIRETCIAEIIHWALCAASLWCLWLWPGFGGFCVAFLYSVGNLPFIMIQRYNRPRLVGLQARIACKI